ncbi:MAG TPA: hypothetical protein EYP08_06390 [Pyrodictiaceae archaeon]|nr:hypothetical protein [Pyrodictiaceae archaeon]
MCLAELLSFEEFKGKIVIVPLASMEDHGVLPLGTDYIIANCIRAKLAKVVAEKNMCSRIAILPALPYTVSIEHRASITAKPATLLTLLKEILSSIAKYTSLIIVLVVHGGVEPIAYMAAREVSTENSVQVVLVDVTEAARRVALRYGLPIACVLHADPLEASILLACKEGAKNVRKADLSEISNYCNMIARNRPREKPWIWRGYEHVLYPDQPVPATERLGSEIVEEIVGMVLEAIEKLEKHCSRQS